MNERRTHTTNGDWYYPTERLIVIDPDVLFEKLKQLGKEIHFPEETKKVEKIENVVWD